MDWSVEVEMVPTDTDFSREKLEECAANAVVVLQDFGAVAAVSPEGRISVRLTSPTALSPAEAVLRGTEVVRRWFSSEAWESGRIEATRMDWIPDAEGREA